MRYYCCDVIFYKAEYRDLKEYLDDIIFTNRAKWTVYDEYGSITMINSFVDNKATFLIASKNDTKSKENVKEVEESIADYIESLRYRTDKMLASYDMRNVVLCTVDVFYSLFLGEKMKSSGHYVYRPKRSYLYNAGLDNDVKLISEELCFFEELCKNTPKHIKSEDINLIMSHKATCDLLSPVNYIIESDNAEERVLMENDLKEILFKSNVIWNERILRLYTGRKYNLPGVRIDNLRTLDGGLVILDTVSEPLKNDYYYESFYEDKGQKTNNLKKILNALYSEERLLEDKFIVIVLIEKIDKELIKILKENCPNWPFYKINVPTLNYKEARKKILEKVGKYSKDDDNIDVSRIVSRLSKDSSFSEREIDQIFNRWYRNEYLIEKDFLEYKNFIDSYYDNNTQISAEKELFSLIGLKDVKDNVIRFKNFCLMEKCRQKINKSYRNQGFHLFFYGNPGTAKTTVARILARLLKEIGMIERAELVECSRADLVGKYVGWTARLVEEKFHEAKGGILFIDEAYSLVDGDNSSFGKEAINAIVQQMENNREDVVVIMAGYKTEMMELLNVNRGMKSRVNYFIEFPDYSKEELFKILEKMAADNFMKLDNGVREYFMKCIDNRIIEGNGRFVRNVFEKAKVNQSTRMIKIKKKDLDKELMLLKQEDFESVDMDTICSGIVEQ